MTWRLHILLLLALAGTTLVALGHGNDTCLTTEESETPVCHHYFEGRRIDVLVREVLDDIDVECQRLVIHILQRQGLLLAPLREPIPLDERNCETMQSVSLNLPNVRSETDVLIQFTHSKAANEYDEKADAAAIIALRVYPDTLLVPLTKLAEQRSLVVFDDDGTLSEFLDANDIGYVQGWDVVFDDPIGIVVRSADAELALDERDITSAVIFREKVVGLPQVRTISANGRIRVYVEVPILHDLRGNPLAQKALLKIINLAIHPNSLERG